MRRVAAAWARRAPQRRGSVRRVSSVPHRGSNPKDAPSEGFSIVNAVQLLASSALVFYAYREAGKEGAQPRAPFLTDADEALARPAVREKMSDTASVVLQHAAAATAAAALVGNTALGARAGTPAGAGLAVAGAALAYWGAARAERFSPERPAAMLGGAALVGAGLACVRTPGAPLLHALFACAGGVAAQSLELVAAPKIEHHKKDMQWAALSAGGFLGGEAAMWLLLRRRLVAAGSLTHPAAFLAAGTLEVSAYVFASHVMRRNYEEVVALADGAAAGDFDAAEAAGAVLFDPRETWTEAKALAKGIVPW